jgi:PKD domain
VTKTTRAALVTLAMIAGGAATAHAQVAPVRLQGTFRMAGTVTTADDVFGEHQGQRVRRTWNLIPQCGGVRCRRVLLERRRSGRHIRDAVMLARQPSGLYLGQGSFSVPLRCAGQVESRGGLATETITVRVTGTQLVGTTRFATAISATYTNPSRVNLTRCPGAIGHDAARYNGHLAGPLPGPPTAAFTVTSDPATTAAGFTDHSTPGRGGAPIVARTWNFDDPNSPTNTSSQADPTHDFSAPGTYTVTLTVRDRYGQTSTETTQVTV